ncbi:hypothetical protein [Amycolatopsis sp. cmx-4-61]|uniref:hypothetical protein n=1 Tax=Amycolatopsis sp. cmx-4-61 TaxID=2790937 RepID=UPI0039792AE4
MTTPTARIRHIGAVILAAASLAACQSGHAATGPSTPDLGTPPTSSADALVPTPGSCTLGHRDGQDLPDTHCTPGTVNSQVTQATIDTTICQPGWTKTVRPPTSVTNKIKQQIDVAYGLPADTKGELDHLISLELGGAPSDPANLWVEPGKIPNPKDTVENKLHAVVCSELVPLTTAQRAIARNWVTAFDDAGLRVAGGKVCLHDNPSKCVGSNHRGDEDGS